MVRAHRTFKSLIHPASSKSSNQSIAIKKEDRPEGLSIVSDNPLGVGKVRRREWRQSCADFRVHNGGGNTTKAQKVEASKEVRIAHQARLNFVNVESNVLFSSQKLVTVKRRALAHNVR